MKKVINYKFLVAIQQRARLKTSAGQYVSAKNLSKTARSFQLFLDSSPVLYKRTFNDLVIHSYAAWLNGRGVCRNTLSFYMRNMRSTWVMLGGEVRDFKGVFTGMDKTRKRAIPVSVIKNLRKLKVDNKLSLWRDLFVFSFVSRGMPFVDMAYLRWTDISQGYIRYMRHKTGRPMCVALEPCMMDIIERWRLDGSPFVFPIIDSDGILGHMQYENGLNSFNKALRKLGVMVGYQQTLTSYSARHTWASVARDVGVPVAIISEGMGHGSERTTQIYLSSFDLSIVDAQSSRVLQAIGW